MVFRLSIVFQPDRILLCDSPGDGFRQCLMVSMNVSDSRDTELLSV